MNKAHSSYVVTIKATFANKETDTFLVTVTAPGRDSARDVARYHALRENPGIVSQTVIGVDLVKASQK